VANCCLQFTDCSYCVLIVHIGTLLFKNKLDHNDVTRHLTICALEYSVMLSAQYFQITISTMQSSELHYSLNCQPITSESCTGHHISNSLRRNEPSLIKVLKHSTCDEGLMSFSPSGGRLANCWAEGSTGGVLPAISAQQSHTTFSWHFGSTEWPCSIFTTVPF